MNMFGYEEAWKTVDHRVDGMLFMSSIKPTLLIVLLSLVAFICGPKYMRTRKPMNIGRLMLYYNIIIIIFNLYVACQLIIGSNNKQYKWLCEPVNSTATDDEEMRIVKTCHSSYLLKLIELFDVFFLIFRKKSIEKQTVYFAHHVFMVILGWAVVRWLPSGFVFYPAMLVSIMHVALYSYLCCLAFFPAVIKLKIIQSALLIFMTSVTIAIFHCGIHLLINCPVSPILMLGITGMGLVFTLVHAAKFVREFSYEKIFEFTQIVDRSN